MRNPLAARHDEHPWDRLGLACVALVGVVLVFTNHGSIYRGWFAGGAFLVSLTFVLVYRRRCWRSTYAGRSTMLSMSVTTLYTGHTSLVLWWPYNGWEKGHALTYLAILIAVLYKLMALTRQSDPAADAADPTTDMTENH